MRVLLAEDHPLMQQAITTLLLPEHKVVAVVARGDELAEAVALHVPDVAILDVSLPGVSGLQVLPQLRQRFPHMAILILTTHSEAAYRKEAHRRGADGYILKGCASQELLPAIQQAVSSRKAGLFQNPQYA